MAVKAKQRDDRPIAEKAPDDWGPRQCETCGYGRFLHQMAREIGAEKLKERHGIEGVCAQYRDAAGS